jgi:hypothetical protein
MFWCKILSFKNPSESSSIWMQQNRLDIIKINNFDVITERKWKKVKL